MNRHIGRQTIGVMILGVGLLSLSGIPMAQAAPGSAPSSPPAFQTLPEQSGINRSIPGAKIGTLKVLNETTAQIDNMTFALAPRIVVESQTGHPLSTGPQWQKRMQYPVPVQYWANRNVITQMIVLSPPKDGPPR